MELKGRRVLVLGMGRSGVAAAKLLLSRGAAVRCSDSAPEAAVASELSLLKGLGCRVEAGGHTALFAKGAEIIVISPGIDPREAAVRRLLSRGMPVISELELAARCCRSRIIAVTGTNGKTTTVTLLERVLCKAGRDATACGNIGRPFSEVAAAGRQPELVVLEVSSFQLEAIREFRPWIAVALNIADDHLDRYADMRAYTKAKAAIFKNQGKGDWAVVRAEDAAVWHSVVRAQRVITFSRTTRLREGAWVEAGSLVIAVDGVRVPFCREGETPFVRGHNVENVLATALAARICGVEAAVIGGAVREFGGLPHRMEEVAVRNEVRFINDSKATNPDAVLRALQSLPGPVILIAGGKDKGFDYSVLREEMARRVKALILIGEAAGRMKEALAQAADISIAGTLA
ncbi:MAG: UDP-N-acetylmuramoyl-L-alanine--D-glutamate ligase, partial [Candidatus Aureabacteria bacterium]|nr:UDP-N-acetylmuramoyl-L-alanine--D-glutamate ligase [Candidatus Auribacterota bacterium]